MAVVCRLCVGLDIAALVSDGKWSERPVSLRDEYSTVVGSGGRHFETVLAAFWHCLPVDTVLSRRVSEQSLVVYAR